MTFSKFILSLGIAATLVGCSTESQKKKDIIVNSPYDYQQTGNFQVSTFNVIHSATTSFNSYGLPEQKIFTFKACIVDQLNASVSQPNLRFTVSDGEGSQEEVVTDRSGCLTWTEVHSYSILLAETYFRIKRIVTSLNYYKGSVDVVAAFNPWLDGGSSLEDTRYKKLPPHAQVEDAGSLSIKGAYLRSKGDAGIRVNLKSASFKFTGLDYDNYEVSQFLNLKVAHKYQVRLSPTVIRKALNKTVVPEVLNTGSMKAILVILREDSNPKTQFTAKNIVTSVEFEDDLLYGELMANVSISFPTVVDLTSRTVALVTLIPKEELDGLPSMSFSGPLNPGLLSSLELKPVSYSALDLHNQFQLKLNNERQVSLKPLDQFVKASNYKLLTTVPAVELSSWSSEKTAQALALYMAKPLRPFTTPYEQLARQLCEHVFPAKGETRHYWYQCYRYPAEYLELRNMNFVEKLNSVRPEPFGLPTVDTFRMSHAISLSDSTSSSVGVSVNGGGSLGWDLPFSLLKGSGALKFSIGGTFAYGRSWKKDDSTSNSVVRDRSVMAEGNSFKIDIMTRKCVAAAPVAHKREVMAKLNVTGVIYCLSELVREQRVETYYLITSKSGVDGSPFSDNASANSSPWKMMIRGPQMLNLFASMVAKPGYQLVLQKEEQQAVEGFAALNQEFPGLLSESAE